MYRYLAMLLGYYGLSLASAAPLPVVSYLQPLGPAVGNLSSITISPDGRYLAFRQDNKTGSASDIYLYDPTTATATQINLTLAGGLPVNAKCDLPALSNEALYAVFLCSGAPMGVPSSQGDAAQSYFAYDRLQNKTELIAQGSANSLVLSYNPIGLSKDGRFAAYRTGKRLANGDISYTLMVRDMVNKVNQATAATSVNVGTQYLRVGVSQDGRFISYAGKSTPSAPMADLAVFDRTTGVTQLQNVSSVGVSAGADSDFAMSADGNFVAFSSTATTLVTPPPSSRAGVYLRERSTGKIELISNPAGNNFNAVSLSMDGRYVSYHQGTATIFIYDRLTKKTRSLAVQLSANGRLSGDGRYLVFQTNQMPGGTGRAIGLYDFGARPNVNLSATSLSLTEGGVAGTYSVVLNQVPDYDVVVGLSADVQLSLARSQLTFTPVDWNVPQVVSVQALQDSIAEGLHSGTVTHTVSSSDIEYAVVAPLTVTAAISDAIVPTLLLPGVTWNRTDLPLTGTAAPGSTVLLTASNRNTGWLTSVSAVADAQGKWSHTLTGLSDGVIEFDVQADGVHGVLQTITVVLPPTFTDVTGSITTLGASMAYNRATGKYVGNFVLTNTGGGTLTGPLQLQLNNLTAGIALSNASGSHDGMPYITVQDGLLPGASVTIPLVFDNPGRVAFDFDAKIFNGSF